MSHIETYKSTVRPNFLASAIGLIAKSCTISATGVEADDDGRKIVKAGTIYPANDATALGILFHDVDVTKGDHEGSLIVAGRILKDRLPTAPDDTVLPVLAASGLIFTESNETTRG